MAARKLNSEALKLIENEQYEIRTQLTIPQTRLYNLGVRIASLVGTIENDNERQQISTELKKQYKIYKDICVPLLKKHRELEHEKTKYY